MNLTQRPRLLRYTDSYVVTLSSSLKTIVLFRDAYENALMSTIISTNVGNRAGYCDPKVKEYTASIAAAYSNARMGLLSVLELPSVSQFDGRTEC